MKKILTAIAVVFFFAITASFCNANKDKPEYVEETIYQGKYDSWVHMYLKSGDDMRAHYACQMVLEVDSNGNKEVSRPFCYLNYGNNDGGRVVFLLDEKDVVWKIDIFNERGDGSHYDCIRKRGENEAFCEKAAKKVIFYQNKIHWNERLKRILEEQKQELSDSVEQLD